VDDKTIGERGKTEPAGSGSSQPTGDAVSSRRFAISATARCERCGGTHTLRQRCPADIEPAAETAIISAPSSPATATVAAPSAPTTYTPAGVRHRYEFASAAGRIDGSVAPPALRTLRRDAPPQHRGFARSSAKWAGAIVGTITLLSCFAVATTYIVNLTQVDQDPAKALAAIFVSLGVGIVFGMALMFISMKTYSKFVFAGLAPVLVTGGFVMLVFAPVVRQMNTPELAEYQAFSDLLWFGALSLVLGVALSAVCLRWALRPHAIRRIARWARILGSAYGVMLGISGVFAIFGLFRLINAEATYSNGSEQSVVEQAISIAAIAMWSFVPGLILTYQGISASMGEGSNEYRPPVAAYGFLLFAGVLVAGQLNMRSDDPIAAPMPLLHVAAAALPGLTFAAMAARGSALRGAPVRSVTWRQFTLAVAISMAIATSIAIYVESLGSLAGVVLLLVHNGAFADAQSQHDVSNIIRNADLILSRNEQFVAALIVASIFAPLAEEFAKSLGVRFLLRRTMMRGQAFMLGAAAGAGFGFLESMLYGLSGISNDLANWWQIMLLRSGSTSLHVLCTGLTGLAWWYWTVARRSRVALGLFGLAVLFHASWNAAFTLLQSRILGLDTLSDRTLETIAYVIVGVVSTAFIIAIPMVARRIREPVPPGVDGTPLAAIAPWLG
jgi:RsiW-degrading membrane proteinase PrsW (M82 family)